MMQTFVCAVLALALPGGFAPPAMSVMHSSLQVIETLDELKAEISASYKEAPLDEAKAVDFSRRALAICKAAKEAGARADSLKVSFTLRFRGSSKDLDEVRGQLWDVVIENDADNVDVVAPLISTYMKDRDRAAALGKRSKAPEIKAACAYIPLTLAAARDDRSEKETQELVAGLKAFQKEFGTVVDPRRKKTWGEASETLLFQVEHLSIGAMAPEIEANDTSGVKFKLSDYRGKVVLLDFWGNW